ncbi:MAG: AmmeMemoRadiSam system protein A [Opitutaceae bacterium]|nr:AmmeMemoRadiSam system protein A [Opitutaceae bacterium]
MTDRPIVFAGLLPHAPVLVPGVGGEHLAHVRATANAMTTVARHTMNAQPDTLVLISPHSPRQSGAFGLWQTPRLRGSLERFGSPSDRVDLPLDRTFADRLATEAKLRGLRIWAIAGEPLDHGATVPLCYLIAAGWKGPTVILSLNYPGEGGLDELGQAIAVTAQALDRRIAFIASGDMSHRLTHSAPSGYHREAHRFDETFIALLRKGAFTEVPRIDPDLQELAAEDAVDSTVVALAVAGYHTDGHEVLSYEGPFGVGYGVAILFEPGRRRNEDTLTEDGAVSRWHELPAVARRAIEAKFQGGAPASPYHAVGELAQRRGVFVTLRTATGELRGCVGTVLPVEDDLVQETWRNAAAAAFHDPRFQPVRIAELSRLRLGVTVLEEPEAVASPEELNPAVYGVVVATSDGRKGVLLPAIPGIDTVEQQLAVARRKAGINPDEPCSIQRFTACSFVDAANTGTGD